MKKLLLKTAMTTALFASLPSYAVPVSIGLGIGFTDPAYKGYSANYYPIPNINFDNGEFFVDGLNIGGYVINDENQSLSLSVNYLPLSFKSRKTDNEQLKKLDNRKATVLAMIRYDYDFSWGELATSAGFDVLNESKTILLNVSYSYSKLLWDKVILAPTLGVNWLNNKHNNYYYGITEEESKRSGLPYFKAKSAFQPYVGLTGTYLVNNDWSVYLGGRIDKLTGDMHDSPMTSRSIITSAYTGVIYTF